MSPTGGFGMNTGIAGRGRSRLEARGGAATAGAAGTCSRSYEIERRRWRSATSPRPSDNLGRMLSTAHNARPPPEIFQPGAAGDAARKEYGDWFTETDAARVVHATAIHLGYRYDDSPIVWPDGTPAPPLEDRDLYADRAAGRARAACLAAATDARRSISSAGLRAAAARRRCAAGDGRRARRGGRGRRAAARGRDRSTRRRSPSSMQRRARAGAAGRPCRLARRRGAATTRARSIDVARGEAQRSAGSGRATSRLPSTPVISSDD